MSIIPIYPNKESFIFCRLCSRLSLHIAFGILAFDVWEVSGYAAAFTAIGIIIGLIFIDPAFIGKRVEKLDTKTSSEKTESEEGSGEISVNSENESLILNIEEKENSKLYATGFFKTPSKRL
jgi:hypothetical protein